MICAMVIVFSNRKQEEDMSKKVKKYLSPFLTLSHHTTARVTNPYFFKVQYHWKKLSHHELIPKELAIGVKENNEPCTFKKFSKNLLKSISLVPVSRSGWVSTFWDQGIILDISPSKNCRYCKNSFWLITVCSLHVTVIVKMS